MTAKLEFERYPIMDTAIHNVSMEETLDIIDRFVAERKPRTIVTANVDHLMLLRKNVVFREVYRRADLVTCDSVPLRWALAFLGTPVKERVAGADIFMASAPRAAEKGYRVFYLGAGPGVAEEAARVLTERHPKLQVVGAYSPPVMSWEELAEDEETLSRIANAKPDILFAAFGAPKQELWLETVRKKLRIPVGVGVGAAFDFAAGSVKRAPRWMQRCGLEWLYRFTQEPGRLWRRYLFVDSRFGFYVLQEKLRGRRAPIPPASPGEDE